MYAWLPPDVELMTDVSAAGWVAERSRPWPKRGHVPVATFMPEAFEAYARVLHPLAYRGGDVRPIRWSEVASRRGVPMHPTIGLAEVTGVAPGDQRAYDDLDPREGSLPDVTLRALLEILTGWTGTDEPVWFGLWEGNGTWWKGAHVVLSTGPVDEVAARRIDDERDRVLRATPTFGMPERRYFLVRGTLRSALGLYEAAGGDSSNLWWPASRAWLVSTEVDGFSTYVGGSHELVDALVASQEVEALPASVDDPMDPGPYLPIPE